MPVLKELLNQNYALAMAPGFYCFYAHCGILHALEELSLYNPTHVSGASAGALIGLFASSGLKPTEMLDKLFQIRREDIWDAGQSFFGILKGIIVA